MSQPQLVIGAHMGKDSLVHDVNNYRRDCKNLAKHGEQLKAYVLQLPKKTIEFSNEQTMGLGANVKDAGLLNKQIKAQSVQEKHKKLEYSLEDAKALCNKLPELNFKRYGFCSCCVNRVQQTFLRGQKTVFQRTG